MVMDGFNQSLSDPVSLIKAVFQTRFKAARRKARDIGVVMFYSCLMSVLFSELDINPSFVCLSGRNEFVSHSDHLLLC